MWDFETTILGEPASKSNSRRVVRIKGVSRLIKSRKALQYAQSFVLQCPTLPEMLDADGSRLMAEIDIFYASRRPDLDPSLIYDLCQNRLYQNDRSIKHTVTRWHLDKENPRSLIRIRKLSADYGEE